MHIDKIKNNPDGTPKKTYGEAIEDFKQGFGLDPGLAKVMKPIADQLRAAAVFKDLTTPKELPPIKIRPFPLSKQDMAELMEKQHARARPMNIWNIFFGICAVVGVLATIVGVVYAALTYYK